MSVTAAPPPTQPAAGEPAEAGVVTQHVRHAYWKYPIIALALAVVLGLLGVFAGSPNSPRATIASTTRQDPGGAVLAFTQELAGMSASTGNEQEFGLGPPGELFVTGPLRSFARLLGGNVAAGLAQLRVRQPTGNVGEQLPQGPRHDHPGADGRRGDGNRREPGLRQDRHPAW
jgi:hypothetical protein